MTPISKLSGMPRMRSVFSNWMQSITLETITQTVVDGFINESIAQTSFKGIIQPLSVQQLMLKPEGERSWQWLQIHAITGSLNLATNDKIIYNGATYKVMGLWDYSLNGFIEYHVAADFA